MFLYAFAYLFIICLLFAICMFARPSEKNSRFATFVNIDLYKQAASHFSTWFSSLSLSIIMSATTATMPEATIVPATTATATTANTTATATTANTTATANATTANTTATTATTIPAAQLLPPPRDGREFETISEAWDWLGDWAAVQGYGVSKKRSKSALNNKVPKLWFHCQRSQAYRDRRKRPLDGVKPRQTTHLATECQFAGMVRINYATGKFIIDITDGGHNHLASSMATWTTHRQREMKKLQEVVISQMRQHLPNRVILDHCRTINPASCISEKDIENLKQRYQKERLGENTPLQPLLDQLPRGGDWIIRYEIKPGSESLSLLFLVHRSSLALLHIYPYMLWMDCTYKTNYFRMPVLDIVGVTATKRSFIAGICFMQEETTEAYTDALRLLKDIYQSFPPRSIPGPLTILTDKERALMKAIKQVIITILSLSLLSTKKSLIGLPRYQEYALSLAYC